MKRYWIFSITLVVLMLMIFGIVYYLGLDLLTGESAPQWMQNSGVIAALGGILLLVGDVVLPVPSSAVMIANGLLYGIFFGTTLSLIGNVGSALVGFWLGRRGSDLIKTFITSEEMEQADQLLKRWGAFAIIVSRPIPMIAETTTIMAGASQMRWRTLFGAAFLGSLPHVLLFALTGATAAAFDNLILAFGLSLAIAGIVWLIGRRYQNEVVVLSKAETQIDEPVDGSSELFFSE
ncbi:MAG: VTT domain-containing protein [Chloroflexota bacterium]